MVIVSLLKRFFIRRLIQIDGVSLVIMAITYAALSWIFLRLSNETALIQNFTDFMYYLVVTGSTVGYGDMSPVTVMGKWLSVLFIIPGGIGLFALVVGQIATTMMLFWKRGIMGKRRLIMNDHIVILGWNNAKTERLISLLRAEPKTNQPIVLCVRDEMENPFPGDVSFVRVSNYTDKETMSLASVSEAKSIIIDIPEDDYTVAAALFCSGVNHTANILVYFQDEGIGDLLRLHCPNVDCVPAVATEMLAKATIDPGSSQLHSELLTSNTGMTQYSINYDAKESTDINYLFQHLKQQYQATLIAIDQGEKLVINPEIDAIVNTGDMLFYIANERIHKMQWK